MKTNTLFGIAFLNYNWEKSHRDMLDTYLPLICDIIISYNISQIDRNDIQAKLNELYGLNTSLGVIENILRRGVSKGILKKDNGLYFAIKDNVKKNINTAKRENIAQQYDEVISNIISFAKRTYKKDFSKEEVEDGLLSILDDYDTDIVIKSQKEVIASLNKIPEKQKIKYIISKYIIHASNIEGSSDFIKLVNIAKGHSIATLIANTNIKSYVGLLNDTKIYLDAPVIFNLLGLNGESNYSLSKELVYELKEKGAQIKVFQINDDEVKQTITEAIRRLTTGDYDIRFSSRVLKTAIREGYTASKLQLKLNQIEDIYKEYDIEIDSGPDFDPKYSIDEKKLTTTIKELYKNGRNRRLYDNQLDSIDRDVQTIAYIFQIRKSISPNTLKQCKAFLLTTNNIIAYSSQKKSISNYGKTAQIAPCNTDLFISSILWANYPSKNDSLKHKQLLSVCYDNIELDDRLFQSFYRDVETMHKEHTIKDEHYYLLNASRITYKLLEKHTLNDIEEYTDKTAREIVDEIIENYTHDSNVIHQNIKRISIFVGNMVFWLLWLSLIILILFTRWILPAIKNDINNLWAWIWSIVAGLFGLWGMLRWVGWIPTKEIFINKVSKRTNNFLIKILTKE